MELHQPKTKTIKTKKVASTTSSFQIEPSPIPAETTAVKEVKKAFTQMIQSQYGAVTSVTSLNLKRRHVNNAYRGSFFMHEEVYTYLSVLGIQMGVTWDEALRGIIDMHKETAQNSNGLLLFVPALNL